MPSLAVPIAKPAFLRLNPSRSSSSASSSTTRIFFFMVPFFPIEWDPSSLVRSILSSVSRHGCERSKILFAREQAFNAGVDPVGVLPRFQSGGVPHEIHLRAMSKERELSGRPMGVDDFVFGVAEQSDEQ